MIYKLLFALWLTLIAVAIGVGSGSWEPNPPLMIVLRVTVMMVSVAQLFVLDSPLSDLELARRIDLSKILSFLSFAAILMLFAAAGGPHFPLTNKDQVFVAAWALFDAGCCQACCVIVSHWPLKARIKERYRDELRAIRRAQRSARRTLTLLPARAKADDSEHAA